MGITKRSAQKGLDILGHRPTWSNLKTFLEFITEANGKVGRPQNTAPAENIGEKRQKAHLKIQKTRMKVQKLQKTMGKVSTVNSNHMKLPIARTELALALQKARKLATMHQ